MLKELLETPEQFVRWLMAQPRGKVVGTRGYTTDCPIARFTNESTGLTSRVGNITVNAWDNDWQVHTSDPTEVYVGNYDDWRYNFIESVDEYKGDDPNLYTFEVTVAECLMHLGQLYPEAIEVVEKELIYA